MVWNLDLMTIINRSYTYSNYTNYKYPVEEYGWKLSNFLKWKVRELVLFIDKEMQEPWIIFVKK